MYVLSSTAAAQGRETNAAESINTAGSPSCLKSRKRNIVPTFHQLGWYAHVSVCTFVWACMNLCFLKEFQPATKQDLILRPHTQLPATPNDALCCYDDGAAIPSSHSLIKYNKETLTLRNGHTNRHMHTHTHRNNKHHSKHTHTPT